MQRMRLSSLVDLARGTAGEVEVVLGDLARAVGVDDEQLVAGEVGQPAQVVAGLVGGERVLAHHEQHRALARRRERLVEHAPAADGDVEPLAVALEGRVAELDLRAGDLADHGRLDDPVGDGLRERVVDHDVAEDAALLVLRCRRVVELGDDAGAGIVGRAAAQLVVESLDRLVPLELLVVDVVGLVVDDHDPLALGDPVEQLLGGGRVDVAVDSRPEHRLDGVGRVLRLAARRRRLVETLDVREIEHAAGRHRSRVVLQEHGEVEVVRPLRRDRADRAGTSRRRRSRSSAARTR